MSRAYRKYMETPKTLQQAIQHFSDEQVCIDAVVQMRWPNGVKCIYCATNKPYWLASQKRWKCRACRNQFSVKVGTIFEDSPISLTKWLPALWLLVSSKNGISSYELARALGVTQKTAWFMLHRIRLSLKQNVFGYKLGDGNGGEVEVDETFIGGKFANMHRDRRARAQAELKAKAGIAGKTIVQGFLDRDLRQVRAQIVPDRKRETLQNAVLKNVRYGSNVYSDNAVGYDKLTWRYVHAVVDHVDCYVKGRVHTNGLENFWSLLKRGLKGTYVAVEPFHLDRYVDEQVFRYNNRATKDNPLNDSDRFLLALSQIADKRITYKELTGKKRQEEAF
jgi:transposase-like protein